MATENLTTTETAADPVELINNLSIRLEALAGVANITAETCEDSDFNGVMCVIEREIQVVRDGLSDVIGAIQPPQTAGVESEGNGKQHASNLRHALSELIEVDSMLSVLRLIDEATPDAADMLIDNAQLQTYCNAMRSKLVPLFQTLGEAADGIDALRKDAAD